MSYWSRADLEGLIGKAAVVAIFDDDRNGFPDVQKIGEVQALADAEVDGTLARTYPGPFTIVQIIPAWTALTNYAVGSMVIPTVATGYAFRAVGKAGASGAVQPTWGTTYGVLLIDGTTTWQCVSITPELVRMASLLWGRALAYERSPEYTKRYGDRPRKLAEKKLQDLTEAKEYLADFIGSPLPGNVGGLIYAHGARMTTDDGNGNELTGDF